jgi:predicted  nucleic acid-binding Zn-ribbon protein
MVKIMSDAKKELQALRKKIAALEKEVEEAKLQEIAWESMVEVAEEMGYPIKKSWDEAMEEARKKLAEMKKKGES